MLLSILNILLLLADLSAAQLNLTHGLPSAELCYEFWGRPEEGFFTNPPAATNEKLGRDWEHNPVWLNGSTQTIRWDYVNEPYAQYELYLVQVVNKGPNYSRLSPLYRGSDLNTYPDGSVGLSSAYPAWNWTVSAAHFNLALSHTFYFYLRNAVPNDTRLSSFRSHYFHITLRDDGDPECEAHIERITATGLGVGIGVGVPVVFFLGMITARDVGENAGLKRNGWAPGLDVDGVGCGWNQR
ncbi:hypothetical protein N0V90_007128 [Kalmusia sp. IMI 367209]|nr:hypothetical protein N0V90_007128 [Kalmusia sp. IMI 367209]